MLSLPQYLNLLCLHRGFRSMADEENMRDQEPEQQVERPRRLLLGARISQLWEYQRLSSAADAYNWSCI